MGKISKRVTDRLSKTIPAFQKILERARTRDVNESDTVMIVTDMLADIFGFDKYTQVTSEQAIRGTYCDLAVKIEDEIKYLIEVKAIGLDLKDNHLRQAVTYGANEGIPWVVLTNSIYWEIYHIRFERPISHDLICSFDVLELSPKREEDLEKVYLLCKEGLTKGKSAIEEFREHSQIVNRHTIAAIICSESVVSVIRRELRRLSPQTSISTEEIDTLLPEVLKRDVVEGSDAEEAMKMIKKSSSKALRERKSRSKKQTQEIQEPTSEQIASSAEPPPTVAASFGTSTGTQSIESTDVQQDENPNSTN